MTHRNDRALRVAALARVEGEGGMKVRVEDGNVTDVQLEIYEPPRFFEAFLRGRGYTEPPDITARICGICPVAYQMSAVRAIEDACGVTIDDGPIADLRRLLYCGEWIQSHALHIYLLHAPDFLGYEGVVDMAAAHLPVVQRGLFLKKVGNEIMTVVGGRSVHPINVKVGGFYRAPEVGELKELAADRLRRALDDAVATVELVAGFEFPDFVKHDELMALVEPDRYAIDRGTVRTSSGLEFPVARFEDYVIEEHVPQSTALHASLAGKGQYFTGPSARFGLSHHLLTPVAKQQAAATRLAENENYRNPFRSIVVRAIEVVFAIEEALAIIERYEPPAKPYVDVPPRDGKGFGATEAPRGTLFHRYEVTAEGTIASARIVPPTSQNQASIEDDLRRFVQDRLDLDDHTLTHACEQAIRNYDPCISCSTHFLDLTVERS